MAKPFSSATHLRQNTLSPTASMNESMVVLQGWPNMALRKLANSITVMPRIELVIFPFVRLAQARDACLAIQAAKIILAESPPPRAVSA